MYELIDYVAENVKIQKLIVGDFNFNNIQWYPEHGSGASAKCSQLNDNVSSLRENLLMQHVGLFAVIKQRLLQGRKTEANYCFYNLKMATARYR